MIVEMFFCALRNISWKGSKMCASSSSKTSKKTFEFGSNSECDRKLIENEEVLIFGSRCCRRRNDGKNFVRETEHVNGSDILQDVLHICLMHEQKKHLRTKWMHLAVVGNI